MPDPNAPCSPDQPQGPSSHDAATRQRAYAEENPQFAALRAVVSNPDPAGLASSEAVKQFQFDSPDTNHALEPQPACLDVSELRRQQSEAYIKGQLDDLYDLLRKIRGAHVAATNLPPSREIAMVRTKLQEALMWATAHGNSLHARGDDFTMRVNSDRIAVEDLCANPFDYHRLP